MVPWTEGGNEQGTLANSLSGCPIFVPLSPLLTTPQDSWASFLPDVQMELEVVPLSDKPRLLPHSSYFHF